MVSGLTASFQITAIKAPERHRRESLTPPFGLGRADFIEGIIGLTDVSPYSIAAGITVAQQINVASPQLSVRAGHT
jgi:hypothetical protein